MVPSVKLKVRRYVIIKEKEEEKDKPYVGILVSQDGSLVVANWIGVDYLVNVKSGSITTKAFNK